MGDLCYNMTQEWASQLLALGYSASMPLSYDRVSGAVDYTLGQLAGQAPGTSHETFHFVLNNTSIKDNRIPPYGFNREYLAPYTRLFASLDTRLPDRVWRATR